jgi:hypothetical protein
MNQAIYAISYYVFKYCSGHCQRQHWQKHRIECESSLNKLDWQPHWIIEGRAPFFYCSTSQSRSNFKNISTRLWGNFPAYDVLQVSRNEGLAPAMYQNIKLCFTGISILVPDGHHSSLIGIA